jgi:hypothetical protein
VADGCSYTLTDMNDELSAFVLFGICSERPEEGGAGTPE